MNDKFWGGMGQPHEVALAGEKVGATEADFTMLIQHPDKFRSVLQYLRGQAEIVVKKSLALVNGDIAIPKLRKPFVVADHFRVDISDQTTKVKISYLGDNFQCWYLKVIVKPRAGYRASSRRLTKGMNDAQIRAELNQGHETDLATVFYLLAKQGKGQPGALHTNGNWNIFYCPDGAGVLRTVGVRWHGDGWSVSAFSVEDPLGWFVGRQVFSRNSVA